MITRWFYDLDPIFNNYNRLSDILDKSLFCQIKLNLNSANAGLHIGYYKIMHSIG
jgi:hypothetical protein